MLNSEIPPFIFTQLPERTSSQARSLGRKFLTPACEKRSTDTDGCGSPSETSQSNHAGIKPIGVPRQPFSASDLSMSGHPEDRRHLRKTSRGTTIKQ